MSRPLLLVTNDDGIHALGLKILAQHLSAVADLIVAAPDQEQSAVGHGISLSRPLRITNHKPGYFAVSGTPADSVLLSLFHLCPRRPVMVISGINLGLNLGTDVFYSGTLAGALEGAIHGVPAMAVSQEISYSHAESPPSQLTLLLEKTARFITRIVTSLIEHPLPSRMTLNINAPAVVSDKYCWTRLGKRAYREQVEKRVDLRGFPYYWIGGPAIPNLGEPGTDAYAIENGIISITPLGLDLSVNPPADYQNWLVEDFQRMDGEI